MKTPNEQYRSNSDVQVEQGFVFCLVPEVSKDFYTDGIEATAREMSTNTLEVRTKSNLGFDAGDIAEEVWNNIQKAEVIVADLTDFSPQVMCEVGIALGVKDSKKIVLLRDDAKEDQSVETPIDLRNLAVASYNRKDLSSFKGELRDKLRKAIGAGPAPHPLEHHEDRKLVKKAMKLTADQEWDVAEILFQKLDRKLGPNWYIYTQWGIMCQEKGEYAQAHELFLKAARNAEHEEHKASIYIEQAILAYRQKNTERAEALFETARKEDPKNRRLYIAWADVYDKLEAPERALAQIAELMNVLGRDDEEAIILTDYYTEKLRDRSFSMKLDEFKKAWHVYRTSGGRASGGKPSAGQNQRSRSTPFDSYSSKNRIPKHITWHDFRNQFKGSVVEGEVNNTHPSMGVFIYLNSEIKGLMHKSKAGPNYQKRFSPGQKIRVRINDIYMKPDGSKVVDLRPA